MSLSFCSASLRLQSDVFQSTRLVCICYPIRYSLQLSASTEASILTGNCLQHIGRSLNNSTPRAIIDVLEAIAIIYNSPKRFEHYQGDRPVRLVLRCCRDIIRWAPFCEPTDLQRARELIATLETLIPRLTVPVWFRSNALHDTDVSTIPRVSGWPPCASSYR